jgi:hypothetical protein
MARTPQEDSGTVFSLVKCQLSSQSCFCQPLSDAAETVAPSALPFMCSQWDLASGSPERLLPLTRTRRVSYFVISERYSIHGWRQPNATQHSYAEARC